MDYKILDNKWTVEVMADFNSLSVQDIREIGKLVCSNLVVIARNQSLTYADEIRICETIGHIPDIYDPNVPADAKRAESISINNKITRVTGKKNKNGDPGLFGHKSALDWHADKASNIHRDPYIWLYGIEGTAGSRTSWINMIEAYNDLPDNIKEKIKDKKVYCGYKQNIYSNSPFFKDHVNMSHPFPLVIQNALGIKGLYFPFLQIFGMEDTNDSEYTEIYNYLKTHVLNEKYMYHHDWKDGDIAISDQWLSIHKRWEFDKIEERLLHRISFNFDKIFPQDDK